MSRCAGFGRFYSDQILKWIEKVFSSSAIHLPSARTLILGWLHQSRSPDVSSITGCNHLPTMFCHKKSTLHHTHCLLKMIASLSSSQLWNYLQKHDLGTADSTGVSDNKRYGKSGHWTLDPRVTGKDFLHILLNDRRGSVLQQNSASPWIGNDCHEVSFRHAVTTCFQLCS